VALRERGSAQKGVDFFPETSITGKIVQIDKNEFGRISSEIQTIVKCLTLGNNRRSYRTRMSFNSKIWIFGIQIVLQRMEMHPSG